jgi:hypothetical protein
MPIPPFDSILNVLPPHIGDPTNPNDLSPYPCSMVEVCTRFPTSLRRKEILTGLLDFRERILNLGIEGFQWLSGSFVEDIEAQERREPRDVDVVTFVTNPADPAALRSVVVPAPELFVRSEIKAKYLIDHFYLPLGSRPDRVVDQTRYWCGLFSHRRDRIWKGMLFVNLDKADDTDARRALGGVP